MPGSSSGARSTCRGCKELWEFYSGKSGIGRFVQTSFLFYGGLTTFMLTAFAIRFNAFDGTLGRTLVGNLAFIGFDQIPGGIILFWVYQMLAVLLLAAASMTAMQDLQATAWRDVAIGEIPEVVVYRNPQGTFTRSVTAGFIIAVILMLLVRGTTSVAVPFYGVGVFMPIMVMGFAIRKHILATYDGRGSAPGAPAWPASVGRPGGGRLRRPDRRQVDRGRLGGADLLQHPDPGSQRLAALPDRQARPADTSTASCARRRVSRDRWPPSWNGSPSRCRNTAIT